MRDSELLGTWLTRAGAWGETAMKNSRGGLMLFALLLAVATTSAAADKKAASLFGPITARRTDQGAVVLQGNVQQLPPGTKVNIEFRRYAGKPVTSPISAEVRVKSDRTFETEPLTQEGRAIAAGAYSIEVLCNFNSAWQSADVLRAVGVETDDRGRSDIDTNPTALPKTPDFVSNDKEFPDAARHIEFDRDLVVQALGEDIAAIEAVKKANLTVPDQGRSELNIEQTTRLFANAGGFTPRRWSASPSAAGKWIVVLDCIDGGKQKEAKWEYDPKAKRVRYLDPLAKLLSWGQRQHGLDGDLGYP